MSLAAQNQIHVHLDEGEGGAKAADRDEIRRFESDQLHVEIDEPRFIAIPAILIVAKIVVRFVVDHDDTWTALRHLVLDLIDGHLKDGWVLIEVASDGTTTTTYHSADATHGPHDVWVRDAQGHEERKTDGSTVTDRDITVDEVLKALREVAKAALG